MHSFIVHSEIRWADLDPNFHVLHSKYYDLGAFSRMSFLVSNGLTPAVMQEIHTGPVIFREECLFKKEIKFGDQVSISLALTKASNDFSRWSMEHIITINGNVTAALINLDGAWINTLERKIAKVSPLLKNIFDKAPRSEKFIFT